MFSFFDYVVGQVYLGKQVLVQELFELEYVVAVELVALLRQASLGQVYRWSCARSRSNCGSVGPVL